MLSHAIHTLSTKMTGMAPSSGPENGDPKHAAAGGCALRCQSSTCSPESGHSIPVLHLQGSHQAAPQQQAC